MIRHPRPWLEKAVFWSDMVFKVALLLACLGSFYALAVVFSALNGGL
jgi:hypothetical protein